MRVAVIGASVAGLGCAYRLARAGISVRLFKAAPHADAADAMFDLNWQGRRLRIDPALLGYHEGQSPQLAALVDELGLPTIAGRFSFSVQYQSAAGRRLEWANHSMSGRFAQRSNLLRPNFLRLQLEIARFRRQGRAWVRQRVVPGISLRRFLDEYGFTLAFREHYLLPLAASLWGCPGSALLDLPMAALISHIACNGLLQRAQAGQWRALSGGAGSLVDALCAAIPGGVSAPLVRAVTRGQQDGRTWCLLHSDQGAERFDHVVLACRSDHAAMLLHDPRHEERSLLNVIQYRPQHAVLHGDTTCLPQQRQARSAANYQYLAGQQRRVGTHYLLNEFDPGLGQKPLILSLGAAASIAPSTALATLQFSQPVLDSAALDAQRRLARIQGTQQTWFAGAWSSHGLYEDGLRSGLMVAAHLQLYHQETALKAA